VGGRRRPAAVLVATLSIIAIAIVGRGSGGAPAASDRSPTGEAPATSLQASAIRSEDAIASGSFEPTPAAWSFGGNSLCVASMAAVLSSVDTACSFLQAMGNDDQALMNTYLIPERRFAVELGDPTPPPYEISNLHCLSASAFWAYRDTATKALVACEFDAREDWGGFSAGWYDWTVSMQRLPPGPWLIDNYGAG
jgi:hypothetical protein